MRLIISIICLAVTVILIPINMVGLTTLPWVVVFAPVMVAVGIGIYTAYGFVSMLRDEKKNTSKETPKIVQITFPDGYTSYAVLPDGAEAEDGKVECGYREWGNPNEEQNEGQGDV